MSVCAGISAFICIFVCVFPVYLLAHWGEAVPLRANPCSCWSANAPSWEWGGPPGNGGSAGKQDRYKPLPSWSWLPAERQPFHEEGSLGAAEARGDGVHLQAALPARGRGHPNPAAWGSGRERGQESPGLETRGPWVASLPGAAEGAWGSLRGRPRTLLSMWRGT